jgi:probable inorganic polyphosphate/ATP-NAD kinase
MRIAIYGSRRQQAAFGKVAEFLRNLAENGDSVVMHGKLYDHLMDAIPDALGVVDTVCDTGDFEADLAISLGGDGTFLRTALWVADKRIPIVGVNTGHLGYLTALSIDQLINLPGLISSDRLRIESRSLLEVTSPELPASTGHFALNEVAVLKEESASMIQAEVSLGGLPMALYRADGLIICTSTGSTAYNLSVGGPIVQPTLDVCVISPIAAHSLSMRPLVFDARESVEIIPRSRARHVRIALDGRSTALDVETPIVIRKAPFKVMVMQTSGHTFADALREKLHWGEN